MTQKLTAKQKAQQSVENLREALVTLREDGATDAAMDEYRRALKGAEDELKRLETKEAK